MLRRAASMNSSRAANMKGEFGLGCAASKRNDDDTTEGLLTISQNAAW